MRRFLIIAALLQLALTLSCSDSTGPGNSDNQDTVIDTVSIDSQGGTVGDEQFSVEVPAGAFDDDTSLTLVAESDQAFNEDAISETYRIDGLPQTFGEDITIRIAYTGDLSDSSYIAVGVDTWVSSLGKMETTFALLPTTVEEGKLITTLPANELAVGKIAHGNADTDISLTVTSVTGYKPHVTAQGHFRIEYASRWTTQASVQQLGEYLEEAYTTIAALGFSYAGRTNWPVSVTVKNLGNEVYGYSSNSFWGDNHGYLEFNSKKMSELDEMRTTAGHEFFHLVQSLYDPRNFYSKAKFPPEHLWLSEATAVWIEEKFSDEQNYVSSARAGNNLTPFTGVVAGASEDAGKHGYGLSAMINYLVGEYGESCIIKMYEEIKKDKSALSAVSTATEEPIIWWDEFLRQYTLGEHYDVSIMELTANKSGMHQFIFASDSLATFTDEYPDLSGKIYVLRLENTYFDENDVLNVSIDSDFGEVSVCKYRVKPLAVELLATDSQSVSISDLDDLEYDGWHLIALVSNIRNIPPYTDSSTITMTARISQSLDPGFTSFTLHPEMIGDFESTIRSDYTSLFYPSFSPAGTGTLNGTTFTGTRNDPWQDGTIVGTYTITFDDTFQNILSITATQSKTTPLTGGTGTSFQNVSFTAHDIPLKSSSDGAYVYRITGNDITDQVTNYTYEYGFTNDPSLDDRLTRLTGYRGGGGSDILIRMMIPEQ